MDIKKADRTALKSYFVKNAIPTQSNFSDLIDGLINQKEDGIAKNAGEPVSLQADGGDTSYKKVINFYKNFADLKAAWTLCLNPRVNPNDAATAKPGWSVGDADGNSKLFIDQNTGNVGVGTVDPGGYKLNVQGSALFAGNYLYVSSESAGRLRVGAAWNMPGLFSGDDGAKPLALGVVAGQKVYLGVNTGDAYVEGGSGNAYFKGIVGVGTTAPTGKFEVVGVGVFSNGNGYGARNNYMAAGSLTIGGTNATYGGGTSWNTNTAGLLLETANNTEIAVHDAGTRISSLMYYQGDTANRITIGRDMGWGKISQVVFGGAIVPAWGNSAAAGIQFPSDPGGGGGDTAWIRYYPRSGESTTLEIGISNDADDHIALMSSGNVGIGTYTPQCKLEVAGAIAAGNSDMYFTKIDHNHSGFGNTAGYAAIENAQNYGSLMILGRAGTDKGRKVQLWDFLQVNGTFVNNSDLREKRDVTDLVYGLKEIMRLRPVSFNWKDIPNPHKSLGLIAQEVKPVIDEAVYQDEEKDGHLSIAYLNLVPVLINAVKELAGRVEELSGELRAKSA